MYNTVLVLVVRWSMTWWSIPSVYDNHAQSKSVNLVKLFYVPPEAYDMIRTRPTAERPSPLPMFLLGFTRISWTTHENIKLGEIHQFTEHARVCYTGKGIVIVNVGSIIVILPTTYMKIFLSLMKSSTADKFPNTWFMTMKKKAPTLQE